jgi:hypothetical protein
LIQRVRPRATARNSSVAKNSSEKTFGRSRSPADATAGVILVRQGHDEVASVAVAIRQQLDRPQRLSA